LIAIATVGIFRGGLQWLQYIFQNLAYENFKTTERQKLLASLYRSKSPNLAPVLSIFGEKINFSCAAVLGIQGLVNQASLALFTALFLLSMAPALTGFAIVSLVLVAIPLRKLDSEITHSAHAIGREWDAVQRILTNSVRNFTLLRIYGTRAIEHDRANGRLIQYYAIIVKYFIHSGTKSVLTQILGLAIVCLLAVWIAKTHALGSAEIITYFFLFMRFSQNSAELARTVSHLSLSWPQLLELIDGSKEHIFGKIDDPSVEAQHHCIQVPISWKVNGISFQYDKESKFIFSDFNLEIKPGGSTAIIGSSGVGKSTLVGLLLGLHTSNKGEISVSFDSKIYRVQDARSKLLSAIGYVGPDSFTFNGTVRENLLYGIGKTVTDIEILEALKKADCDFLFDLPEGLNHRLTDQGAGLSAGQMQRIALARALLRKPCAIILDEATANLDSVTELRLIEVFKSLLGKVTLVIVTHKDSMLVLADQVVRLPAK
jgi:ABC-type bacteriocin/lantibiotic exporter with double-glycine peptidase domain